MEQQQQVKVTLSNMLAHFDALDQNETYWAENFDLDVSHDLTIDDLKEKVDSIVAMIDHWEKEEAWLKLKEEKLSKRRQTYRNKIDKLMDYVAYSMDAFGYEELPGIEHRLYFKKNPPSVISDYDPDESTMMEYPTLVRKIPPVLARYEWDKNAIKAIAKQGEPLPEGVSVVRGSKLKIGDKR